MADGKTAICSGLIVWKSVLGQVLRAVHDPLQINGCTCSVGKNIAVGIGIGVSSLLHLGINIIGNFAINPPSLYAKTVVDGRFVFCQSVCLNIHGMSMASESNPLQF